MSAFDAVVYRGNCCATERSRKTVERHDMHAFHNQRGSQVARVRHRHEDERDFLLWCFAHRAIAEEFAVEFRGTLMG